MNSALRNLGLVIAGAILATAILVACGAAPTSRASSGALPPMFKVGATVYRGLPMVTKKMPYQILEVNGEWIKAKGAEQGDPWFYVPGTSAEWFEKE